MIKLSGKEFANDRFQQLENTATKIDKIFELESLGRFMAFQEKNAVVSDADEQTSWRRSQIGEAISSCCSALRKQKIVNCADVGGAP